MVRHRGNRRYPARLALLEEERFGARPNRKNLYRANHRHGARHARPKASFAGSNGESNVQCQLHEARSLAILERIGKRNSGHQTAMREAGEFSKGMKQRLTLEKD